MTHRTTLSLYLLAGLISVGVEGAEFHISPMGTPQGNGTPQYPLDLATALSGVVGGAGDTFWLRGGTYRGQFYCALQGRPDDPITVRQYPGERATIDGSILQNTGGYVTYWGFELTSSYPSHTSFQGDAVPTDLPTIMGMNLRAPGLRLINLVVHDHTSNGIGLWSESPDSEIYGCILYHNGWDGADRGHGHGIYSQNRIGKKRLADNISFQNYSDGIQIYGTDAAFLNNFELEGNVLFNNGIISRWPGGNNLQLGGGVAASGIVLRHNYTYCPFDLAAAVNIGSEVDNQDLLFENNLIQGSLRIMNWGRSTVMSNLVFAGNSLLELQQFLPGLRHWDWNTYHSDELIFAPFSLVNTAGSFALSFPLWQMFTGMDASSTYQRGAPAGARVVARPNAYEPGRGHVVVYNWDRRLEVEADLSKILFQGYRFEARHAQDYFGAPVLSGIYTGQVIRIPMYAPVAVAAPVGRAPPRPLGPDFGVYIFQSLLPESESVVLEEDQPLNWHWARLLVNDGALGPISSLTIQPGCGASNRGGSFCLTNGFLQYQPPTNYAGVDFLEYGVLDSLGITSTGEVYFSIYPAPDPPQANTDRVEIVEDQPEDWHATEFLANDLDPDGDVILIESVDSLSARGGTVTFQDSVIRYFPPTNFFGTDQFAYRLVDATQLSATGRVVMTVAAVNDPPVAFPLQLQTREDLALDLTLQAADVEDDLLSYQIVTPPQHGVLQGSAAQWRYTPFSHFSGDDQFSFRVHDGVLDSEPALVTISILRVNDAPTARNASYKGDPGDPLSLILEATDPDEDPLTYEITELPAQGQIEGEPPRLLYRPPQFFEGQVALRFRVSDGEFVSNEAVIQILIGSTNPPPVALSQTLTNLEDAPLEIRLEGFDPNNKPISYSVTGLTRNGALNGAPPSLTYTPNPNFYGEDSLTFRVNNGEKMSAEATITIQVLPVNDPPAAYPSNLLTIQNKSVGLYLGGFDVEGDRLGYEIVSPPAHGRLIGTPPGLSYWPNPGYLGPDLFRFRTTDGQSNSEEAVVSIYISLPASPPQPPRITSTTLQQGRMSLHLLGEPDRIYTIEMSQDMMSWTPVSTNFSDFLGEFSFEVPTPADQPRQFYRATHPALAAE